ncbi:hypothetical protein SAMN05216553_101276 [Lentzea fradiae]|uniref:Uncharacterized protein n=1 Tax=Lentzea fradiae TaxID=200378 RepID=A0A1G7KGT0_9PSEU|nr:hypothetical protein SAMN05216553_101276 [Lentzea fradiae]
MPLGSRHRLRRGALAAFTAVELFAASAYPARADPPSVVDSAAIPTLRDRVSETRPASGAGLPTMHLTCGYVPPPVGTEATFAGSWPGRSACTS